MFRLLVFILSTFGIYTHLLEYEETQPHNSDCYCQGLFFLNSTHMFESCGLYGKSYFHVLEYETNPFRIK